MPTYEYRCPAGHDFEKFYRKISDAGAEVPCPECGQIGTRRLSAGAGLVFKGSGFYITDYGKDGKKDQQAASRPKVKSETGGDSSGQTPSGSGGGESGAAPAPKSSTDAKSSTETKPAAPAKESKASPPPAPKPGKSSSE